MIREILTLGALIVGICGLLLGNGLFGTLSALRMSEEGFDPTIIGVVLSCHSIGFIVGCLYGQRIGHIRCFTAFAAVLAVVCPILPMPVNPYSWILLHLVFGFCSAMVLMVAESWLTGAASSETKGRVFSVYMVINKGSFGTGQLLSLLGHPSGDRLFMLTEILFGLCLVTVPLASKGAPPNIDAERISLWDLYRHSRLALSAPLRQVSRMRHPWALDLSSARKSASAHPVYRISWRTFCWAASSCKSRSAVSPAASITAAS